MGNCEKCDSEKGHGIYCKPSPLNKCGCGVLKYWNCECGHVTSYFHITKLGKEVLRVLLDEPEAVNETKKRMSE